MSRILFLFFLIIKQEKPKKSLNISAYYQSFLASDRLVTSVDNLEILERLRHAHTT